MKPEPATTGKPTNVSGCRLKSAADLGIIERLERLELKLIDLHDALHRYDQRSVKIKEIKSKYNDRHLFI